MAKTKTIYRCSSCGNETLRWLGKCPTCGAFNTIEEHSVGEGSAGTAAQAGLKSGQGIKPATKASTLSQLKGRPLTRTPTGIEELDRVLGGGFVDAMVVLLAGHPGSGKSTVCMDIANRFAGLGKTVLYSSGEESEQQIALRAERMGVTDERIKIINETNLETLRGHMDEVKPDLLIVDSLQTIASNEISGSIGGLAQSKEAAHALTRWAKTEGITMVLINQIIKSGEFAGSEAIQHIVDCSLIFESDKDTPLKFLRSTKNRFGDISEVGVFQHSEKGLEEVSDPSGTLIDQDGLDAHGTACTFQSEGMRQIPSEIQALVVRSNLTNPRKQFSGVNFQRGQIVCAILDKFCRATLFDKDVFLSTVAGLRLDDPQADLAIAAALLSSDRDRGFNGRTAFVGELGLTGFVRGGFMVEQKVKEAARLGFDQIVVPKAAMKGLSSKTTQTIRVVPISRVEELTGLFQKK